MPSPTFIVTLLSAASDGTNIFLEVQIFNGSTTSPLFKPIFEVGTTAATIAAYLQAIATARPVLDSSIAALVGTTYLG